jgi:hypothetical protein
VQGKGRRGRGGGGEGEIDEREGERDEREAEDAGQAGVLRIISGEVDRELCVWVECARRSVNASVFVVTLR